VVLRGLKFNFAKRAKPGERVALWVKGIQTRPHFSAFFTLNTADKRFIVIRQNRHKSLL
jgi:hypothetical protein